MFENFDQLPSEFPDKISVSQAFKYLKESVEYRAIHAIEIIQDGDQPAQIDFAAIRERLTGKNNTIRNPIFKSSPGRLPLILAAQNVTEIIPSTGISLMFIQTSSFKFYSYSVVPNQSNEVELLLVNQLLKNNNIVNSIKQGNILPVLIKYEPTSLSRLRRLLNPSRR